MAEAVYKIIELNGTSKTSVEAAIQNAVSRASETVRNLKWFEVIETRGSIKNDRVSDWQVTIKIGFSVDGKSIEQEKTTNAQSGAGRQKSEKAQEPGKEQPPKQASKYRCKVCGYIYDPDKGDPSQQIKPGTPFEDLPGDWQCPECGVNKEQFEKI